MNVIVLAVIVTPLVWFLAMELRAEIEAKRPRRCPYCDYSLDLAGHELCRRLAASEDYDPRDDRG